jgi:hypothetical protein
MPRHALIDRFTLEAALVGLEHQKSQLDTLATEVRRMLRATDAKGTATAAPKPRKKRRRMSAAARKRISEATRKRWAEYRKQQPA